MQLLDRYLQSVANFLPAKNREDVLAELRANLQSEMEEHAADLGRPITEDEQADILRRHGYPMLVASRYFPQQSLIGPAWIASYWFTLKLSTGISATIMLAINLLLVALGRISASTLFAHVLGFGGIALDIFAIVTLAFMTGEYFSRRYHWDKSIHGTQWDPRKLPAIRMTAKPAKGDSKSQFCGAILGLILVVAWKSWPLFTPASVTNSLRFSSGWHVLYQVLLTVTILQVIVAFVRIFRPDWQALRYLSNIALYTAVLFALGRLFKAGNWVSATSSSPRALSWVAVIDHIFFWLLAVWMLSLGISILVDCWRCANLWRQRSVPASSTTAALA